MTTITQFLDKMNSGALGVEEATGSVPVKVTFKQMSETAWGIAAFTLFLLLGPFSAIAAIISVMSMAKQSNGAEPEAMS